MHPVDDLIKKLRAWDKTYNCGGVLSNPQGELQARLEILRDLRALPSTNEETFLYLASPYRHKQPRVEAYRARMAAEIAGMLKTEGLMVFSPVAHGHAIAEQVPELSRAEWASTWLRHGKMMLRLSHAVAVLRLHGWEESEGVAVEMSEAGRRGIPLFPLDPTKGIEAFLRDYKEAGFSV